MNAGVGTHQAIGKDIISGERLVKTLERLKEKDFDKDTEDELEEE